MKRTIIGGLIVAAMTIGLAVSARCEKWHPVVIGEWTIDHPPGGNCSAIAAYGLDGKAHVKRQSYEIYFAIGLERGSQDFDYTFSIGVGALGNYAKWLSNSDSARFIEKQTGQEWNFQTTEYSANTMMVREELKKVLTPITFIYNNRFVRVPQGDESLIRQALKDCSLRG